MSNKKKRPRSKCPRNKSAKFDQINPLDTTNCESMSELLNEPRITKSCAYERKPKPHKKHTIVSLPLDLENLPSMEEIFVKTEDSVPTRKVVPKNSKGKIHRSKKAMIASQLPTFEPLGTMEQFMVHHDGIPSKKEVIEGTVIGKQKNGIVIDIGYGSQGFIDRGFIEIWNSVETGDKILVSFNSAKIKDNFPDLIPHKILSRSRKGGSKSNPKIHKKSLKGKCFVIDGSNINRSYLNLNGSSSLTPLLTLITVLLSYKARFYCIFDANERFVLEKNIYEPQGMRIYDTLIRELRTVFCQVIGGTNADDTILEIAHRHELPIISNDRYDKIEDRHKETYLWLITNPSRLIKGKAENGNLKIKSLGIHVPLGNNLAVLAEQVKQSFA